MRKYDRRMNPWDNFVWGLWKPFVCCLLRHTITCYKIVPTQPQKWVWMCDRCVDMWDSNESCGVCQNGCPPKEVEHDESSKQA